MNVKQISSFLAYMIWMSLLSTIVPVTFWFNGLDWILVSIIILVIHSFSMFLIRTKIQDNDVLFFIFTGMPVVGVAFLVMLGFDSDLRQMIYSRGRINWHVLNIFQFLSRVKLYRIETTDIDLYTPFKSIHYKKITNEDGEKVHRFYVKIHNEADYALLLLVNPDIGKNE